MSPYNNHSVLNLCRAWKGVSNSIEHLGVHVHKTGKAIYSTMIRNAGKNGNFDVAVDEVVHAWASSMRTSSKATFIFIASPLSIRVD